MSFEDQVRDTQEETNTTERTRTNPDTVDEVPSTPESKPAVPTSAHLSSDDDREADDEPNHKWKRWVRWSLTAFSMATEVTGYAVTKAHESKPDSLPLAKVSVGFKLASNAQLLIKLPVQYFTGEMSYDGTYGNVTTAINLTLHLVDNIATSRYASENTKMLETASNCSALFKAREALFFFSIITCAIWAAYTIGSCIACFIKRKKPAAGSP